MMLNQEKQGLFYKRLLQRSYNAATSTHEWQNLRIRQREEITNIGLLMMSLADWLRQTDEVTALGILQTLRLNLLLLNHPNEIVSIIYF